MLRVEGLTRKFVFEDIRFSLKKGEILGLCGLVGSGRTEIARGLCGIDKTDGGTVWLDGEKSILKIMPRPFGMVCAILLKIGNWTGFFWK